MKTWQSLNSEITTCWLCPRLVTWREEVARKKRRAYQDWEYWGKPVPGFGDPEARILVVGLAPGAHGANRTGRMFTGDGSGEFLYAALYQAGFASQPRATRPDDGLTLNDIFISAVCRCAPPANKPTPGEIANCLPYLQKEIALLDNLQGLVALGRIAFDGIRQVYQERGANIPRLAFGHGEFYQFGDDFPWLVSSYHPSRQNTQTGRLTEAMFAEIWQKVKRLLNR